MELIAVNLSMMNPMNGFFFTNERGLVIFSEFVWGVKKIPKLRILFSPLFHVPKGQNPQGRDIFHQQFFLILQQVQECVKLRCTDNISAVPNRNFVKFCILHIADNLKLFANFRSKAQKSIYAWLLGVCGVIPSPVMVGTLLMEVPGTPTDIDLNLILILAGKISCPY